MPTGAANEEAIPSGFHLGRCTPNPFSRTTSIEFDVPPDLGERLSQSLANISEALLDELPDDAAKRYRLVDPWKEGNRYAGVTLESSRAHTFTLAPFEALVLEAQPLK